MSNSDGTVEEGLEALGLRQHLHHVVDSAVIGVEKPDPAIFPDIAKTKAATSAVYAELDTRITATAPQMEDALKKAGVPYQITVYPGVNHAFHNDTGGTRYDAVQAAKAWVATIEWFRKYLA